MIPLFPQRARALALGSLLCACAHAQTPSLPAQPAHSPATSSAPRAAPSLPPLATLSSKDLLEQTKTRVDAYLLEGGAWLTDLPVLINQDFDFAIAMSLDGLGAGIAAAKRRSNNQQRAEELSRVRLSPEVLAEIDRLRAQGHHAFFVLWGKDEAVLKLVVEKDARCDERAPPVIRDSAARAWEGEEGWKETGVMSGEAEGLVRADSSTSPAIAAPTQCRNGRR